MSDTHQIPKNPSNLPELLDNNEKWAKAVKASYPDFFRYTAALDPQEPKVRGQPALLFFRTLTVLADCFRYFG